MFIRNSCTRTARLGLMGVLICLLVIPLSSCKKATPTAETAAATTAMPTAETVTLTFAYNQVDIQYFELLVQKFNEQYPHITVDLYALTPDGLEDLGADEADVREVWQVVVGNLQEQGDILALDPFIEQDQSFTLSDFYPATLAAFTIEGKVWAIPSGVNPLVVYYNKDLFDQYGVPYPENGWTWGEFLDAALAIRDPETGVFGYVNLVGPYDPLMFVYQHGGRIFDDIQNPTRVTFDDPLTVEAVEWYGDLYHDYNVAPTPQQVRRELNGSIERGVWEGRVGMWCFEFFQQGGRDWLVKWNMNWGMVTLPRDAQAATGGMSGGYAISSQTQHLDAAWQWIVFLSEQTREYTVPTRKSIAESIRHEQQVGEDVAAFERTSLENGLFFSPRVYTRFEGSLDIFGEAVNRVIAEEWTAHEAMGWAQREAESRMEP